MENSDRRKAARAGGGALSAEAGESALRRIFFRQPELFAFLLLFCVLAGGCGENEEVVRVDLSHRERIVVAKPAEAVTYAYLPQYSHTTSYTRHNPLVEYLERESGLTMRQVFPDTFEEHTRMVERGEIDISFSNPFTYVRLAQKGATAFARVIEPSGRPFFRGQIIARIDSGIRRLEDCEGKRWIAVDPLSAGGYLFALGMFHDMGLDTDDFAAVDFAPGPGGKQEKAVLAVYAGKYDFASIREGTLDIVRDKIDPERIRVVATTQAYPGWVYAARKGLDPAVVDRIRNAMFRLSMEEPEGGRILANAGIRGIIPAADADYAPIRELMSKLDLYGEVDW
ncbi:phosphonate ABC transporter, periplasmic phosphonate-binding protein [Oleidesulfovibrio alaskensis G20]|uniref:Phosphonate ABC transporter, periplasmic phosphonate-binding protein n=1 Tax=Oleidesulfovibrio alaskensis (strain ATCC BAA-1058 / DSM 17464 / G20) TaxID=207559 RepID=Q315J4_OLEA2|nr:phosphonate ABC transporter, periplasmic phosphonate-binding protein [Oleidesulfovibrio alaskensis G20]